jgi:Branched-chain amino acid transport protein (AzlD)
MTGVWITIAALCAGTAAIKAAGPLAVGGREPSRRAAAVIRLLAPALLSALVVYESLNAGGRGIDVGARLVGLAAAAVALALRRSLIVVVIAAAAATALARALT